MQQPAWCQDHHPNRGVTTLRVVCGLFALLVIVFSGQSASAQDAEISIQAQVKDQVRDADGKADNQPVQGVTITVLDEAGSEVGSAVTDAKGIALIVVPGKANYVIKLDESTLPDDLALAANATAEQAVSAESFITNKKVVNFSLDKARVLFSPMSTVSRNESPMAFVLGW